MLKDSRGLPVANADRAAIAAIDHALGQWLGYGADLARFVTFAATVPDVPMVQMQSATLHLSMDAPDAHANARRLLDAAAERAADMTSREREWLVGCRAWAAGDTARAREAFDWVVDGWPRDLFAAKLAQLLHFNVGDFEGMLRVADRIAPSNRDNGYVLGMRAFALEQLNRLEEAEADGRRAVEMNPADAWAHHAVAHVMETRGKLDEGIAWMEAHAPSWERCNSFMYTHNWWHLALYHIDRDQPSRALELYDWRVWGRWKEFCQDQINAVSLLARLELRGVDVGDRWRDVAIYLKPRLHEHYSAFLDLHYLYGLARAGERAAATEMLASLEERAGRARSFEHAAWVEACLPAARGLMAYGEGDWKQAARLLGRALPHLQSIGGSHAQRGLFGTIHVDALIRAGWNDLAATALAADDRARGSVPHVKRQLATVYARMGRAEDAAAIGLHGDRLARRYATA